MVKYIQEYSVLLGLLFGLLAISVSLIALYYTMRQFSMKEGAKFRGSYRMGQDIGGYYVSSLKLENLKDRSIAVYSIFLTIGRNIILRLEEFDDQPLVIHPFEVKHFNFDTVQYYDCEGKSKVDLNKIFNTPGLSTKLVLYTNVGKHVVEKKSEPIPFSDKTSKNYFSKYIIPVRFYYYDKAYGRDVKFLLEYLGKNNKMNVLPIKESDSKVNRLNFLKLTPQILSTKDSLEKHLTELNIFNQLNVIDVEEKLKPLQFKYGDKTLELKPLSFYSYHILGRIQTFVEKRKMRRGDPDRISRVRTETKIFYNSKNPRPEV